MPAINLTSPLCGPISAATEKVFTFVAPPLGLPDMQHALLLRNGSTAWIQCVDAPALMMLCIDPVAAFGTDYEIGFDDAADIDEDNPDHMLLLAPVTLDRGSRRHTANLRHPFLVGLRSHRIIQLIIEDQRLDDAMPVLQPLAAVG